MIFCYFTHSESSSYASLICCNLFEDWYLFTLFITLIRVEIEWAKFNIFTFDIGSCYCGVVVSVYFNFFFQVELLAIGYLSFWSVSAQHVMVEKPFLPKRRLHIPCLCWFLLLSFAFAVFTVCWDKSFSWNNLLFWDAFFISWVKHIWLSKGADTS